ncbi:hypothetical protein HYALB_00002500 [Hymenoscyphus albidus]|uniref:Uncharacterized protein n=1 Tax=Hymenoscyphus albidus TaxID=595503 RepID=A0A9N9LVV5_9HELO|nr:hypothetical protein HYALB_00002500 [Hymenoscyphus albidus]
MPRPATNRGKEAVELITFHSLQVRSNQLSDFRTHVTGNRRKYLTRLIYHIVLPEYPKEVYGHVETAHEQQANSKAFTHAIRDLFSTPKSWEAEGLQSTLRLEFPFRGAYSQTDLRVEHMVDIRPRGGVDIFQKRFEDSFLEISDSVDFPSLSNVLWLIIRSNSPRQLAPTVGTSLAAHLPNLKTISWHFGESDEKDKMVKNRIKFAQALDQTQIPHCSAADLEFYQGGRNHSQHRYGIKPDILAEVPSHHGKPGHARVPAGSPYDQLCSSLRLFSHNLTSLILSGHFDPSLFWPSRDETSASPPTWPNLVQLKVMFNQVSPSGDWYFTGHQPDPDDADDEYCQFREHGDEATLNPFLTAFSKAIQNMPVLEHFMLECELGHELGYWEVAYYAPGQKAEWGDEGPEDHLVRRLYYTVGEVCKPNGVIADRLRSVGREKYGEQILERFLERRTWRYT